MYVMFVMSVLSVLSVFVEVVFDEKLVIKIILYESPMDQNFVKEKFIWQLKKVDKSLEKNSLCNKSKKYFISLINIKKNIK